jgi:hypothetical protein
MSTSEPPSSKPPAQTSSIATPGLSGALAVADPSGPPAPSYSARFEIGYPGKLNRWLPLVKWLLAIPHFIAVWFVDIGAVFVLLYAWFAVVFTGRWPRGAFAYVVGALRWTYRVLAYVHLMTDDYPPFSLEDDPNYPVRLNIDYPDHHIGRWRPLVHGLLAIPYLAVAGALYYLTGILTLVAFFTVVFTEEIPRGVFELMVPWFRWEVRGSAYAYFMIDDYPPFVWG